MKTLLRLPMTVAFVVAVHYLFTQLLWPLVQHGTEAAGLHSHLSEALLLVFGVAYIMLMWLGWHYLTRGDLPRWPGTRAGTEVGTEAPPQGDAAVDAESQHRLGLALLFGNGVAKDHQKARQYFAQAAALGFLPAQLSLGLMLVEGQGGEVDATVGLQWLERVAAQGIAHAQFTLGNVYRLGRHIPADPGKALQWYRLAAAQGYVMAQTNLGLMFASGLGTNADPVEAYKWLTLGSTRKDALATRHLGELRAGLSEAQIAEGEQRANDELIRLLRAFANGEVALNAAPITGVVLEAGPDGKPAQRHALGLAEILLPPDYARTDTQGRPVVFQGARLPTVTIALMRPDVAVSPEQRELLLNEIVPETLIEQATRAQGTLRIALKRESLPDGSDLGAAGLDITREGEPAFLVTCSVVAADARIANINIQGAGRVEDNYQRALTLVRGLRW